MGGERGVGHPARLRRLEADLSRRAEDALGDDAAQRVAQDGLRLAVAVQELRRQRERELGDAAVEERQAHLAAVGHRVAVGVAQQLGQAGVERLAQQLAAQRRRDRARSGGAGRGGAGVPPPPGGVRASRAAPVAAGERLGQALGAASADEPRRARPARQRAGGGREALRAERPAVERRIAGEQLVGALAVEHHGDARLARRAHHAPLRVDARRLPTGSSWSTTSASRSASRLGGGRLDGVVLDDAGGERDRVRRSDHSSRSKPGKRAVNAWRRWSPASSALSATIAGRVDAAAQRCADRHVGAQAQADGVQQQLAQVRRPRRRSAPGMSTGCGVQ